MTQFETDLNTSLTINSNETNKAYYNLIVSIRDMKLYQIGMKPHRFWRISDVKNYFGVKGNKEAVLSQLLILKDKYFQA